jgi:hypothetical protein
VVLGGDRVPVGRIYVFDEPSLGAHHVGCGVGRPNSEAPQTFVVVAASQVMGKRVSDFLLPLTAMELWPGAKVGT